MTILDNLDIHRVKPKVIFLGYYIAEHYKECLLKTSIANSKWNILCTYIHGDNFFHWLFWEIIMPGTEIISKHLFVPANLHNAGLLDSME